ncbi:MAG: hypothetical protein IPL80_19915 [Sterolibacteriaceae bacterium]|nr:hypothetical protein [Sterolibacteriaceae bacterium]
MNPNPPMRLSPRRQAVEAWQVPSNGVYADMQSVADWCSGLVCNAGAVISVGGQIARPGDYIVEDITPGRYVVRAAADIDRIYRAA